MLKALLKKQLLEMNSFYFQDRKTGKLRSKKNIALYICLYVFIFISAASGFAGTAFMLSEALLNTPQSWLYFSLMFTVAGGFGVLGSVFNTYTSLFHAKDNELLLAMPIPPSVILFVRMSGIFLWSMFFEALVLIPALIMYFVKGSPSFLSTVLFVLLALFNGILITAISCLLGFFVALISAKVKSKSIITVILSLCFLGAYFFICSKIESVLTMFVTDTEGTGNKIKSFAYPIYAMGKAAEGHIPSFFIFAALCSLIFAVMYFFVSKSITKIMSLGNPAKKTSYKEKPVKVASLSAALLKKEFIHLKSSSVYMLNCCLGIVFMPVLSVLSVVYAEKLREFVPALLGENAGLMPVFIAAVSCIATSMNDITAPSISLEGKNVWLLHSMPVPTEKIFEAKERLHVILTFPLAALLALCLSFVFGLDLTSVVYVILFVFAFVVLSARTGLAVNLKMPNMTWKDETVPVKQSLSVLLMMLFGFAVPIVLTVAEYYAQRLIPVDTCVLISAIVLIFAARLLNTWISKRGTEIFDSL